MIKRFVFASMVLGIVAPYGNSQGIPEQAADLNGIEAVLNYYMKLRETIDLLSEEDAAQLELESFVKFNEAKGKSIIVDEQLREIMRENVRKSRKLKLAIATADDVTQRMIDQANNKGEAETILLENLKAYMTDDIRDDWPYMHAIVRKLTEIGSTKTVQFFLDNISWCYSEEAPYVDIDNIFRSIRHRLNRFHVMGDALTKMKDVPLRQCMDTLVKSKDGTLENLMLEYVTGTIHGKDNFMREVEKLIQTSPDPKRWKAMKERLEKNEILRLPDPEPPIANKTPAGNGGTGDRKAVPAKDTPAQK